MWAYLDGAFIEKTQPAVALENRGLTFGDGLFEILRTVGGRILFFEEHLRRMRASAETLAIPFPHAPGTIASAALELVRRNRVDDGELYIELTRGVDPHREHRFPPQGTPPTFFMLAFPLRAIDPENRLRGASVHVVPDRRHGLCEHKTLNLLANVLAKNEAASAGAYEALMVREDADGRYATEGGSSNYFCVRDGALLTPELDNILPGVTRGKVLELGRSLGVPVVEKRVRLEEFITAEEVFLASTVSKVMPVRAIDSVVFAAPGRVTAALQAAYEEVFRRG